MTAIYARCAELFYHLLLTTWASEEAMEAAFRACKRGPTFDRTTHGRAVVQHLFTEAWAAAHGGKPPVPVLVDRYAVLAALYPLVEGDFNLFTQVAPNLLDVHFTVRAEDLVKTIADLEAEFSSRTDVPNPFVEKRPKVKVTAATHPAETVRHYAFAVAMIKVASILRGCDFPNMSHRITPFGRTPAFSDSCNFGQLPAVGDRFYHPSLLGGDEGLLTQAFTSWGAAHEESLPAKLEDDGALTLLELPAGRQTFRSESGGSMLRQALVARRGAFLLWGEWLQHGALPGAMVLPRVNSVQIIGPEAFIQAVEARVTTPENQQWLNWARNARPEVLKD